MKLRGLILRGKYFVFVIEFILVLNSQQCFSFVFGTEYATAYKWLKTAQAMKGGVQFSNEGKNGHSAPPEFHRAEKEAPV